MNLLPIVAQATTFVGTNSGRSFVWLLGSLGAAGTAVVFTRWYVGFLENKSERQRGVIEDFKGSHTDLQKNFQDQLDRLSDRHQDTQQEFQAYVALMSDIQNMILRDVIATMKNIEKLGGDQNRTDLGEHTNIDTPRPNVELTDNPDFNAASGSV